MTRSEPKRSRPLERRSRLDRKRAPKQSQPKRDWTEARAKVERESQCRAWTHNLDETGCEGRLEAAHVIRREVDKLYCTGYPERKEQASPWRVFQVRIVPLCPKHHRAYDAHELDLLPSLTVEEQAQAVLDAGGIDLARRRTAPLAYRKEQP